MVYTFFLFFFVFSSSQLCLADKAVVTSLDAKWAHTSFLAETSEFVAAEGNEYFWKYVDNSITLSSNTNWTTRTHEQEYDSAVQLASIFLSRARFSLLKFALALRLYSPRIRVFQQIASEYSVSASCVAFVDVNGAVTCNIDEIKSLIDGAVEREIFSLYSIDHVYNSKQNKELPYAILYADIDSVDFGLFHQKMSKLSETGLINYVFRHFKKNSEEDNLVGLMGYGVELAIKNTEYKALDDSNVAKDEVDDAADSDIFGFNFNVLRKNHEGYKESLNQFRKHLLETEELSPMKQWEVADLGFQAAQAIMDVDPEEALNILIDLSQNFPTRSRSLVQTKVKKALRDEIIETQNTLSHDYDIGEGENALYLNGINIDVDSLDVFQLFNSVSKEESLANAFYEMGFRREYLSVLYKMDLTEDKTSYAIDYRSAHPEYINDLDKDSRYREWGNSVRLLLQPTFPGMIRPIARNFFTLICVIDPAAFDSRSLFKITNYLFVHQVPIRIGFVFVVSEDKSKTGESDVGIALLNLYNFIKSDKSPIKAITFLTKLFDTYSSDVLTADNVHAFFKKHYRDIDIADVFGKDSDYDQGRSSGSAFLKRSGLQTTPKVLLNGVVFDESSIQSDRIEESILLQVMRQTGALQKAVHSGRLKDSDNIQNWVLNQPDVLPRVNNRLLRDPSNYLDLRDVNPCHAKILSQFIQLVPSQRTQCIIESLKYLTKTDSEDTMWLNIWLIGDFSTPKGRNLLRNGLKALKKLTHLRLSVLHNGISHNDNKLTDAKLIHSIMQLYPSNIAKQMLNKFLGEIEPPTANNARDAYVKRSKDFESIAVHGTSLDALKKMTSTSTFEELKIQEKFVEKDLGMNAIDLAVVVNGFVYGPFNSTEDFEMDDFLLLEKIFQRRGAKALAAQVDEWEVSKEGGKSSTVVMRSVAVIGKYAIKKSRTFIEILNDSESVINIVSQDGSRPVVDITAVVNPLSRSAQKLAPILQVLLNVVNCDLRVILNPKSRLSELPLKRFYRYVLSDQPHFNSEGRIISPSVSFRDLPTKQLFTLNLNSPDSWMVQPVYAEYDLDNIKLMTTKSSVIARFELIHILLEGHCFDEVTGNPPRGLQYMLGTKNHPNRYDTIVMANLGYFQLKASPGAWILKLREGKSYDIYEIKSAVENEGQSNEHVTVLIDNFLGLTIRIRVAKREGMEQHNLLSDSTDSNQDSVASFFAADDEEKNPIWSTITNTLVGGEQYEKINIFSLASGHLYERFLRIMMLSVMKNTKHPVKFWLLNNYLSPHFRKSISKLAERLNFEYELIEYKWPRWLHQQTDKQRVMWGYKILFLDVLFPLDVKKIIFVDADQVVRADMMDLMTFDLGGAPYGYTPFCDSRKTMDGFRFWRQGYWANHLAGRKYHISALYVVDLVKFRQIAAGDRLRGQYQGLSSDPNSLSNLDQDLPNNMIHQVRIKSLPQEWLWCETWCSDESKTSAKTIDLCNNPQTKEPKLDSAMRIIPEWNEYDAEIKQLFENDATKLHKAIIEEETETNDKVLKQHGDEL